MNNVTRKSDELPSVNELTNHMKFVCKILYKTWKMELSKKLKELKFKGEISVMNYHPDIGRLPNVYVKSALAQIQNELDILEYEYKFKFDNVLEGNKWVLTYEIELPEDTDHCSFYEETDFFTKPDEKVDAYIKNKDTYPNKTNKLNKNVCTRDLTDENDPFIFEKDYTYLKNTM
jgi:hypothetical protein